jgi:hypothetical protein
VEKTSPDPVGSNRVKNASLRAKNEKDPEGGIQVQEVRQAPGARAVDFHDPPKGGEGLGAAQRREGQEDDEGSCHGGYSGW